MKRATFDPLLRRLRTKDTEKVQVGGGGTSSGGSSGSSAPIETKDEGVTLTPTTGSIDFKGAGVSATVVGNDVSVTIPGSSGGHTIQEDTVSLTARTKLNFSTGITATDNAGTDATDVTVTKSGIGLGNVDNTSDANKPISTATQIALDTKVTGPASVTDDLPAIFDGTTGKLIKSKTYSAFKTLLSLVKGDVGLGNVDNTSDVNKPVSTAQQTAIDAKVEDNITDGHTTVAPSGNAVFDALALKLGATAAAGGDLTGNYPNPTIKSGVALSGNPTTTTQTPGDSSTKIATTGYVDAAVQGTDAKDAVKYATTGALPAVIYNNGSSGVGATLTGAGVGALSLDSATPSVGDRILVKDQVSTFQNGIYSVTAVGSGIAVFVMTRTTDFDQTADIDIGDSTFVTAGTVNPNRTYVQNGTQSPTMGTDPLTFALIAGPGAITSGNGITVTGLSVAIDTSITVDKTTAQTLTNKSLTTPKVASLYQDSIGGSNLLTMPAATDTLVGRATTDTLTNKDISSSTNTYRAATTSLLGASELATDTEAQAGTDTTRTITPSNLQATGGVDGWKTSPALTYSSADAPVFVAQATGDYTNIIHPGHKFYCTQTNANLKAYYKFATGALTTDETAGAHTLSLVSDPAFSAIRFGNGVDFDGNDAYSAVDHADFKPTGNFTVGFWMKTTTTAATQALCQSQSANTNIAGWRFFLNSNNYITFRSGKNTGTTLATDYQEVVGSSTSGGRVVTDGVPHWVVATYDGANLTVYIDGFLDGQTAWTNAAAYAATNYVRWAAGNSSGSDGSFYTGQMSDWFILNGTALTPGQIYALYCQNTVLGTGVNIPQEFFCHGVVYDGTNTKFTLYGGDSFTLANATITNPRYSYAQVPVGFPITPNRWRESFVTNSSSLQATPVSGTIYNPGSISITAPIGVWNVNFHSSIRALTTATQTQGQSYIALSTANNALADSTNSNMNLRSKQIVLTGGASGTLEVRLPGLRSDFVINTQVKTVIYGVASTGSAVMQSIGFDAGNTPTVIMLTDAFL